MIVNAKFGYIGVHIPNRPVGSEVSILIGFKQILITNLMPIIDNLSQGSLQCGAFLPISWLIIVFTIVRSLSKNAHGKKC